MKMILLCFSYLLLPAAAFAQSNSGIFIKVIDRAGDGLVGWPVFVYNGGREITRAYTNDDGEALAKPLSPNTYEVRVDYEGVVRRIENILIGTSETVTLKMDFRPGASDTVQPKGRILVRVLDTAGKELTSYPVSFFWHGQLLKTDYTDRNGAAASQLLYPGIYEVQVKIRDSIHTATNIRVDSGDAWRSFYFKPPRNPRREQRRGIKAYRKWEKQAAQEAEEAARKRGQPERIRVR